MTTTFTARRSDELTVREMHDLLKLRVDVFVVEQECPYAEIDGRDLLEDTVQLLAHEDGELVAAQRVLGVHDAEPSIGRVVTRADARGRGLAGALLERGIELCRPEATIRLGAQAHLEQWYGRFGFVRAGEDYLEDGIPHCPMLRTPRG